MSPRLVVLTGGARGGKSRTALEIATALGGEGVTFIATAEATDDEMRERIDRHRRERNPAWETIEAPHAPAAALRRARHDVVVLDCVTLLVANVLLSRGAEAAGEAVANLLVAWRERGSSLIVVTNEVGFGIVPGDPSTRLYRDVLGAANQQLMSHATHGYLMVAGIKVQLKGEPL